MNVRAGLCIGLLLTASCASGPREASKVHLETGAFRDLARVETELRRGVSTKEDVRRLFGEPNGDGGAFLPTATKSSEVWFYEDIEGDAVGSAPGGVIRIEMRWQVLVVFFDGARFDGFLWFTSAEEVKAEAR